MAPLSIVLGPDAPIVSLDAMRPYTSWHANDKFAYAPREHYPIISHLATLLTRAAADAGEEPPLFVDVGSYLGFSALALHQGVKTAIDGGATAGARIVTYDIVDCTGDVPPERTFKALRSPTFEVRIGDCLEKVEELARASLIVLDVDPHDGVQERVMITRLVEAGFKGLLLLDDIHLNPAMEALWAWVPCADKLDLTRIGHHSGSALANFDPDRFAVTLRRPL